MNSNTTDDYSFKKIEIFASDIKMVCRTIANMISYSITYHVLRIIRIKKSPDINVTELIKMMVSYTAHTCPVKMLQGIVPHTFFIFLVARNTS